MWCCFANEYKEWEEEYFGENGVAYYFDYPAVMSDCMIILSNKEFYEWILYFSKKYLKVYPGDNEIVNMYLQIIAKEI